MSDIRESDIEKYLVDRVKEIGGEIRKVNWLGRRGAPDRFAMLPGAAVNTWIELKKPGEKPEPHQVREHTRMRRMGERVEVIDSFDGVDELLMEVV